MLGLVLLYVGAVLIINSLSMLGKIDAREAAIMNLFTGLTSVAVCAHTAFEATRIEGVKDAAFGLLFGFTYLWVAYNSWKNQDGRGLGWFSLFVTLTALPIFGLAWKHAFTIGDKWLALDWLAWALLWFSFFYLNVIDREKRLLKPIAYFAIAQGVITAWMPGFLLLTELMPR